jgi:capsular polysaccharide biosynthesis protein
MKFNNARVFDTKGFIITENDNVIIELSREFSQNKYTIFNRFSLGKLSKYNNCVAVLTTAGANVYYHWLFDILPRIHLLKESGIFEKIRYFILTELKFDFQKQSLRLLNFPLEKIIEIKSNQQIKADFLFVPSLPSLLGTVNQWSVDFIRNSFLNKNDIISNRKLYISRKNAVGRKVENEQLLTNLLKKYNFEIIDPGSMTFDEQIKTFASASHVISPHGSGLSNIVFCNPGCIIVDIFPPSFIIPCFWILSNKLSHNYYYFIGEGEVENEFTDYWNSKNSDINIDLDKFQILLNKINLEPPCSISHS